MKFEHTDTDLPIESQYPKLVRDNIPEIIEAKLGRRPETRTLDDDFEFDKFLRKKAIEETHELGAAETKEHIAEEVADVFEVIDELLKLHGIGLEEVRKVQAQKREKRGGFKKRLVVIKKIED